MGKQIKTQKRQNGSKELLNSFRTLRYDVCIQIVILTVYMSLPFPVGVPGQV